MNNGDLQSFIKAHQILKTKIKEEEIWNILLQCLSALEYLRKENVFQLGIRVTNIYLNNEQNVKLGLFYNMIKVKDKNRNIQEDIEFLGLFLYKMCYSMYEFTFYKKKENKIEEDVESGEESYEEIEDDNHIRKKVKSEWNDDFYIKRKEILLHSIE